MGQVQGAYNTYHTIYTLPSIPYPIRYALSMNPSNTTSIYQKKKKTLHLSLSLPLSSPPHPPLLSIPQKPISPIHIQLRDKQPRKPTDILPATDTSREIRHGQSDPAILADAQAATGPGEDGAGRRLADDALRATTSEAVGAVFPGRGVRCVGDGCGWRISGGGGGGRRIRGLLLAAVARTACQDEVFEQALLFVGREFARGRAGREVAGPEAGGGQDVGFVGCEEAAGLRAGEGTVGGEVLGEEAGFVPVGGGVRVEEAGEAGGGEGRFELGGAFSVVEPVVRVGVLLGRGSASVLRGGVVVVVVRLPACVGGVGG